MSKEVITVLLPSFACTLQGVKRDQGRFYSILNPPDTKGEIQYLRSSVGNSLLDIGHSSFLPPAYPGIRRGSLPGSAALRFSLPFS